MLGIVSIGHCFVDFRLAAILPPFACRLSRLTYLQLDNCLLHSTPALTSVSRLVGLDTLSLVINSAVDRPPLSLEQVPEPGGGGGGAGGVGQQEEGVVADGYIGWEGGGGDGGGVGGEGENGWEGGGGGGGGAGGSGGGGGGGGGSTFVDAGALASLTSLTRLVELELSLFFRYELLTLVWTQADTSWISHCSSGSMDLGEEMTHLLGHTVMSDVELCFRLPLLPPPPSLQQRAPPLHPGPAHLTRVSLSGLPCACWRRGPAWHWGPAQTGIPSGK